MSGLWWQAVSDFVSPERLGRILASGAAIVAVLLFAHLAIRLGSRAIDRIFARAGDDRRLLTPGKAVTLRGLLKSVLRYAVDFAAVVLVLAQLGVRPEALLAGVGIAGLAIGFGAQNLVRDVIAGFFILLEDQFHVGEHVAIDGMEGIVEEIGLRVSKIRDFGGQLHIIPNGRIERVTNFSRGPMRVLFDVSVPYEADLEEAMRVIQQACDALRAEDPRIVEGPRVLGVTRLGESSVAIGVWARTLPGEQWDVERRLRLRIKQALDAAGIDIPYPRRVLIPTAPVPAAQGAEPAPPAQGAAPAAGVQALPGGMAPPAAVPADAAPASPPHGGRAAPGE